MAYYDKKLVVWLPKNSDVITPIELEKPKKKEVFIPTDPVDEIIKEAAEKSIDPEEFLKKVEPTIDEIFDQPHITDENVLDPIENPIELTPEEKTILIAEKEAQIKALEGPYRYEVDEDDVEWWICNLCEKAYNSETVQKRHQTLKHK